jgi:hypothetical protein
MRRWQAKATAQGEAVDHRHHRLAQLFDARHQALAVAREVARLGRAQAVHLGDVGAGHEGLGAGAGQHHHAHRGVRGGGLEGQVQLGQGVVVERVELVGAVERDPADGASVLDEQVAEGHGGSVRAGVRGTIGVGAGRKRAPGPCQ